MIDTTAAYQELETLIMATWTDAAGGYHSIKASRKNWRDMIASGQLEPPFVVFRPLKPTKMTPYSVGARGQRVPIEITYVRNARPTTEEKADGIDVAWSIEKKLDALALALHDGVFDTFLVPDDPTYDSGDQVEANIYLIDGIQSPYQAGTVYVDIEIMAADE